MNNLINASLVFAAFLAGVSCSEVRWKNAEFPEGEPVRVDIGINVGEMVMAKVTKSSEASSVVTMAAEPMTPGLEKYAKTIAIFEFDNEGFHIKSPTTYHFIDFIAGKVDGISGIVDPSNAGVVRTTLGGIALESRSNGMLCFVVNVSTDDVSDFYEEYKTEGQSVGNISLDSFMKWSMLFQYKHDSNATYAENDKVLGHVETMYMFGYYHGRIDASATNGISVDLGRLACRFDITIVNETGLDLDKRFEYHFDNICREAFFFPTTSSRTQNVSSGLLNTLICSGEESLDGVDRIFPAGRSHTRYFYAAANTAANEDEACKLHLIYGGPIGEDDVLYGNGTEIKLPLCNVHPSMAPSVKNGYSLSRNTCYAFTFRLKSSPSETQVKSVYADDDSGDIIIYLP